MDALLTLNYMLFSLVQSRFSILSPEPNENTISDHIKRLSL
jgi:hypothetical protein